MVNEENNALEASTSLAAKTVGVEYIWEAAFALGFPAAIWRLPETDIVRLIVSEETLPAEVTADLEKLSEGFLMAGFSGKTLFLEGNLSLCFPVENPVGTIQFEDKGHFSTQIFERAAELQSAAGVNPTQNRLIPRDSDGLEERYKRIVRLGADAVRNGDLFKVVLSRTKSFHTAPGFSLVSAFLKLETTYRTAFVSMVSLPYLAEVWLGASPELLVGVKNRRYFRTVALAGTQSAKDSAGQVKPKLKVLWSEKEIEEQAIVSRYIIECFKKIRLREYKESGPKSSKAGNLYHLKSDFEVDLEAVNFPELGSVMLRLLHPTSAVCGMPKEKALQLIDALEGYDRSFYSGFWGPVNMDENTELFVNLRTLRVREGMMTLFAGAGITADSDPEDEWMETEMKCDTLLGVIDPSVSFLK